MVQLPFPGLGRNFHTDDADLTENDPFISLGSFRTFPPPPMVGIIGASWRHFLGRDEPLARPGRGAGSEANFLQLPSPGHPGPRVPLEQWGVHPIAAIPVSPILEACMRADLSNTEG